MNDADVGKQIQQMVRFILQEAEEKASEISVAAEEEFNIEKLQLVESEKRRIRQDYERKAKQVDVGRKIEYSTQLNAARIKVLRAQDGVVGEMKEDAGKSLLRVTKDATAYRKVLKGLIVQSLLRLREPSVVLRCREADRGHVESVLEAAKKEYAEKAKVNLPKILIDGKVYLPPPKTARDAHGPFCSGGVVIASQDGKIVCNNTLDARVEISFKQKLPEVYMSYLIHQCMVIQWI
ncbi:V-type proton ATPase subunit E2-like isoform X1 [Oryza glaberrima]|uniref:V-type proton ATPase subunit E2-like isoform X1 n=1 Tax=Oryza glaberrima TaxID=4538 RepID=UPI00224C49D4|nr:V-type proton ATPase subunit E2-like isoform X1 [Oryza glaberrima]